tara:strand:- start:1813 stop:3348 length:1536 start_codon:yes stop_codon:yes gene_type:complete
MAEDNTNTSVSIHNALLANVLGKTAFERIVQQSLGEHVSAVDGGRILQFIRSQLLPIILGRLARGSVCAAVSEGSMQIRMEHVYRGSDACLNFMKLQIPRSIRSCKTIMKGPSARYEEAGREYIDQKTKQVKTKKKPSFNTDHMNTACVNMPNSSFAKLFAHVCAQTQMYMANELKSTILGPSLAFSSLSGAVSSRVRNSVFQSLGSELARQDSRSSDGVTVIQYRKPVSGPNEKAVSSLVTVSANRGDRDTAKNQILQNMESMRKSALEVIKSIRANQLLVQSQKGTASTGRAVDRNKLVRRKIALSHSFAHVMTKLVEFQISYDNEYSKLKMERLKEAKMRDENNETSASLKKKKFTANASVSKIQLRKLRVFPVVSPATYVCLVAQYHVEAAIRNFVVNMRDKSVIRLRRPRNSDSVRKITTQLKLEDALAAMADFLDMPYTTYLATIQKARATSVRTGGDEAANDSPYMSSSSFRTRSSFRDEGLQSSSVESMADWYSFVAESASPY